MTTTPINIDYNGIQINATNNDISITLTMDGTDKGLIFQYDKTTGNPKTFKITSSGFNFTDNTNNYTTPISNIALLSNVLASLQLPPNSHTLSVNRTLQLTDNTTTSNIEIQSGNLNVDVNNSGVAVFNQCPQCSIAPTNANDLVNKTYVDNNVYNITSVGNNQDYFPVLTTGTGTGAPLFIDSITGPFRYNPSNGSITTQSLVLDQVNNKIRAGSIAQSQASSAGNDTIALGTATGFSQSAGAIALGQNAANPISLPQNPQGTNAIAIGSSAARNSQGNEAIAIGFNAGRESQGLGAIAIGQSAAQGVSSPLAGQGQYAIAIGSQAQSAGSGDYAITIGGSSTANTFQAANSIILNGTGSSLANTTANSFVVRPLRGLTWGIGAGSLYYNSTTGEISFSTN
jgi:hypothetical protein